MTNKTIYICWRSRQQARHYKWSAGTLYRVDSGWPKAMPRLTESLPECTAAATANNTVDITHKAKHTDTCSGTCEVLSTRVINWPPEWCGWEVPLGTTLVKATCCVTTDNLCLFFTARCSSAWTHHSGWHATNCDGSYRTHPEGGSTC